VASSIITIRAYVACCIPTEERSRPTAGSGTSLGGSIDL